MTQFSLSWGTHKNNICTGLSALQQNGEFVDMTLAADGHHVKVHQLVLSLASPYLKDIITSTQCRHPVVFLNKISYATLCAILEYIYTGEVLIAKENLNELIAAGKELHINGLQDMMCMKVALHTSIDVNLNAIHVTAGDVKCNNSQPPFFPLDIVKVDISARSNTAGTQVAGYNEGHQLTSDNLKEPERTPISMTKQTKELQSNTTMLDKDNETNYSSDNADMTLDDPMETESPSTGRETDALAKKKDKSETRIQYTLSNQGALQLILNRYLYFLEYTSTRDRSVRRWRCTDNRYNRCQALVITKGEVVVQRKHAHIHPFHDKKVLKKVRDKSIFSALADAQEHVQQNKNKTSPDPTTN